MVDADDKSKSLSDKMSDKIYSKLRERQSWAYRKAVGETKSQRTREYHSKHSHHDPSTDESIELSMLTANQRACPINALNNVKDTRMAYHKHHRHYNNSITRKQVRDGRGWHNSTC